MEDFHDNFNKKISSFLQNPLKNFWRNLRRTSETPGFLKEFLNDFFEWVAGWITEEITKIWDERIYKGNPADLPKQSIVESKESLLIFKVISKEFSKEYDFEPFRPNGMWYFEPNKRHAPQKQIGKAYQWQKRLAIVSSVRGSLNL